MIVDNGKTLKLLKELTKQDILSCRLCTVKKVDKTKFTCTVSPIDSPDITLANIRFSPSDKGEFVIIPKKDSLVIVSFFDKSSGYISMFSEVDQYLISNSDEKFGKFLDDFLQAILDIQLTTSYGPTVSKGVINTATFEDLKQRAKKLFYK
jgi:hypothetical protein